MRGGINRTEGEVGSEDLPDDLGLEPDVGLCAADLDVAARPARELERVQLVVELLQELLAEASADLADRLVVLAVGVVACEQERAVPVRALALAVVRADDDQVERVAYAGQVVLLQLSVSVAASSNAP